MAKEKLVEAIADMHEDFAQWYTDVVKKAELVDYSSVRGCVILRPYGYAVWELIQGCLDSQFKKLGHENVYMPMFVPESLLQKEKDHVEGFAPEVAWVTRGGSEPLAEKLCVRPTSETLFCEHYASIIQSHRDLPKLYNQWCSVVRWEKTTRPFLRTTEFLWQEGHTAHATAEEAQAETIQMLNVYADFFKNTLAIPIVKGQKTDKEKFAGAKATYTIEALMHDGKALQSATSHNFSDGFARAFDIKYTDKDNEQKHVFQTSWGLSTRTIGALIMVHGDNNGLVLPPRVAPIQAVIVPIATHKEGVIEKASELFERVNSKFRTKLDITDKSPGFKFSEYEMKGVPVRVELGPKDIEKNQAVLVRRDTREKIVVSLDNIEAEIATLLDKIHDGLYEKAVEALNQKTNYATNIEDFKRILEEKSGFVKSMWCGDVECELSIKEQTTATSRCIPFDQEQLSSECICCKREAKHMVYWGKAY